MRAAEGLAYALAGLAWAALLYRAPALVRGRRDGVRRALWTTLLAVALAVTVRLPPVRDAVDRLAGVPNLSQLFENGFILVGIWGVQELLVHLHRPPPASGAPGPSAGAPRPAGGLAPGRPGGHGLPALPAHTWLLGAALAAMAVLFALAPVHEPAEDFWVRFADAPLMLGYRLIYLAYLSLGLLAVVRRCTRYARSTARPTVALGLRLCAVGGAVGLAYAGHEAAYALLRRAGAAYPLEGLVEPGRLRGVLIVAALAPLLVGSTLPAWGERAGLAAALAALGRRADGYRAYRAHRRLYPLWRDLVRATPEVALQETPPRLLDLLSGRDLRLRLYRRVIEIWDGRLALRPVPRRGRRGRGAARLPRGRRRGPGGAVRRRGGRPGGGGAGEGPRAPGGRAGGPPARRPHRPGGARRGVARRRRRGARPGRPVLPHLARRAGGGGADGARGGGGRRAAVCAGGGGRVTAERARDGAGTRAAPAGGPGWPRRLARLVTEVLAPAPVVAALLLAVAWRSAPTPAEAVTWALLAAAFCSALPMLYILRGVRRGRLTDHHVRLRRQRRGPLLVAGASVLVGLALLLAAGAPRAVVALVGAGGVGLAVAVAITLVWKISVHAAVAAGAVVVLVLVFGPALLVLAPLVALSAWARVQLEDHTPAQVAGGAAVGATVAGVVFSVLR